MGVGSNITLQVTLSTNMGSRGRTGGSSVGMPVPKMGRIPFMVLQIRSEPHEEKHDGHKKEATNVGNLSVQVLRSFPASTQALSSWPGSRTARAEGRRRRSNGILATGRKLLALPRGP